MNNLENLNHAVIYHEEKPTNYCIYENGIVVNSKNNYVIKYHLSWDKYLVVSLYIDKKYRKKFVHKLLAEAFIPNPNKYRQVMFIDGNINNISLDNLAWRPDYSEDLIKRCCELLSAGQTVVDVSRILDIGYGTVHAIYNRNLFKNISNPYTFPKGLCEKSHKRGSLSDKIVHDICQKYIAGKTLIDISKETGVKYRMVQSIIYNDAYNRISSQYNLKKYAHNKNNTVSSL